MNIDKVKEHPYWISFVFFLLAAAPGLWMPCLSNVLREHHLGHLVEWAFLIPSVSIMISPLIFAAQVDQRFHAEHVLGGILIVGAFFLFLAFQAIESGWGGSWFLVFFGINCLISAPAWSLLTTITLSYVPRDGTRFGLFRVWGTIGWMCAGVLVSVLALDFSPKTGMLSAGVRIVAGIACLLLPQTKPQAGQAKSLSEALGLGALKILKERDQAVYFMTAFLYSIPLVAFYLHTPIHLKELGVRQISAMMASAQAVEMVTMLGLGIMLMKFRARTILLGALGAGVLRFAFCATDHLSGLWVGILLHGICWTFFYEAGRVYVNRRVEDALRSQAQALLGLVTGGLAGVLGVFFTKFLYKICVVEAESWFIYWSVLSMICLVATVLFILKGETRCTEQEE